MANSPGRADLSRTVSLDDRPRLHEVAEKMVSMFHGEDLEGALQRLADFARKQGFTFTKFESLGDQIIMLAATRWEHSVVAHLLLRQIPRPITCMLSNVDLKLSAEPGEPIPDLIVVPEQLAPGAKPWAHETELLVEVVSQSNYLADYAGKRVRYALSGAPQYLLVDPRKGLCVLHSEPDKAAEDYTETVTTSFGEPISGINCMDGADVDTSEFRRYL